MPGRTSLNVLRSKEENPGMVGLRGRPIKNYKSKMLSILVLEMGEKKMKKQKVMDIRRK